MRAPLDGVPAVIETDAELADAAQLLAAGTGPIAIDAERASGHRYGQRAFLVQLRRDGAGTMLIDPVQLTDTSPMARAIKTGEWILHSATQDLPCLQDLGLRPSAIFDTEVAARLLGLSRVGLAGLTEDLLGVGLAKGHGAADWSKRPLPDSWLNYAALDVELLAELRDDLIERLERAGRTEWARQEFEWLLTWQPKVRIDPWRRTSAISKVPNERGLAIVAALWQAREGVAQSVDRPPSRVMRDESIIAAARSTPPTQKALSEMRDFKGQGRHLEVWWQAISDAQQVPDEDLPPKNLNENPPPVRAWERRRPLAATRLRQVREVLGTRSDELGIALEILVSPEAIRSIVWDSDDDVAVPIEQVSQALIEHGCRLWQQELVTELITDALTPRQLLTTDLSDVVTHDTPT